MIRYLANKRMIRMKNNVKRVIGVFGARDHGKTHLLKWVAEILKSRANGTPVPSSLSGGDIKEVVTYNGKVIAICSGGDDVKAIESNCAFFDSNQDVEIAMSAVKFFGNTCNKLREWAEKPDIETYRKAHFEPFPKRDDECWRREAEMFIDLYL